MGVAEAWDFMTEHGIATEEELSLVLALNGYTKDTFKDVLYARTGYRSFKQYRKGEL